jgi:protein O-GlcNAc transferase
MGSTPVPASVSELLAAAIEHHQSGRLPDAERLLRQIVEVEPGHANANYLLGVMAYQAGQLEQAAACWRRTIQAMADFAEAHNNLGVALKDQGKLNEAVASYRRATELKPDYPEAHNNLGVAVKQQGRVNEAVACYRRALQLKPDYAAAHNNLGDALMSRNRTEDAIASYRRAIDLNPNCAEAHNNLGVAWQNRKKLADAIASYRRAIELKLDYTEAFSNLGNALKDDGRTEEAIACWRRALELDPDFAEAHNNLGVARKDQGKLDEAIACYRRALELQPGFTEAIINLSVACMKLGNFDEAFACSRRALELAPNFVEAHNNLGNVLREQGELEQAVACYRQALLRKPDYAAVHSNLGNALKDLGRLDEAVACYRRAIALKPELPQAHSNLGVALSALGMLDEAIACYRRAVELDPDFGQAYSNLGVAFREKGKSDDAVAFCLRAAELKPDYAEGLINLGAAYKDQGRLDEAVDCLRRALVMKPGLVEARSNLVYAHSFSPGCDAAAIYEEARSWDRCHAAPLAGSVEPHRNDRSPDRRLRVGYVSPDFRNHCQSFFTVPLFSSHDRENYEIVCYSDVVRGDHITERLRSHADLWRITIGLTHVRLAQQIRADGIDILVDLTMHMARNRLMAFARKPAPVQVSWLAYPGTTGLAAIDYRITDPHLDPPGLFDGYYSEESIRLPDTFWCYDPLEQETTVSDLPAKAKGHVTFGCLNNFCKINPQVLKLWARVLKAVNGSRMIILANAGSHRDHAAELMVAEGVNGDRLAFVSQQPRQQYLKHYHEIDIGLDTFPYNGHTTSLDSFWMGVPVVTLCGQTVVGRAGLCQLMNLGLPELIAASPDDYVRIAVALAGDVPRLSGLRATLRARMQASPLMDARRFARNLEAVYRRMWRRWCG